jgi:succinate-acetate transporter protein
MEALHHMGHVAMNTLIWDAAVVLWIIGLVEMGVDKRHELKDFGYVLLTGAIMETIAMLFVIASGNMFGATAAAAFIFLLWALAFGVITGTNRAVTNHAVWFTGVYFLLATIFLLKHGQPITLVLMFGLLVPITFLLSLANYTGNHGMAKFAGLLSAIDGILFFAWAAGSAMGYKLP